MACMAMYLHVWLCMAMYVYVRLCRIMYVYAGLYIYIASSKERQTTI